MSKEKILKTKFSCKRDGLTIRGYEYRPQRANFPIAIVSHGFMANLMTVKHYAEYLTKMGYAALKYSLKIRLVSFQFRFQPYNFVVKSETMLFHKENFANE